MRFSPSTGSVEPAGGVSMGRILANARRAGGAIVVFALATWLSVPRAADAWSLRELLPARQTDVAATTAIAPSDSAERPVYRHRRLWRHVRHHRRHWHPAIEARVSPPMSAMMPEQGSNAPKTMPVASAVPSALQLVISTDDGGDPFEQLMTSYYWSRLNHAMSAEQIFEPARRYAGPPTQDTQTAHYIAASLIEKSLNR